MYGCDIRQYLIRQNMCCTILPNITLANILSYTLCVFVVAHLAVKYSYACTLTNSV